MPLKVIVTRDFDHMSEVAVRLLVEDIRLKLGRKGRCVLGLATGNTPTGLYKHLAKSANAGEFDPSKMVSFNLDEYVGLPGENPQQRALHMQSYSFFMVQELFGLMRKKPAEMNVPWGTLVNPQRLVQELQANPGDWALQGGGAGQAIVIHRAAQAEYLRWIRNDLLDAYERRIEAAGGIDLQVMGVGQKGHVGFHEAGISFDTGSMLLVKLDDNTVANAVADGHFASIQESPPYAISMGVQLIFRARTVLLLAHGARKAKVMVESLLREPDCSVPVSYGQVYAGKGGRLVYVLDEVAAAGILERADDVRRRGVEIEDIRERSASVRVKDLCFSRDEVTGLMG